jgi:hypothetical protein
MGESIMREQIALRNGFVSVQSVNNNINRAPNHLTIVMTVQAELMKLGFMLSDTAIQTLNLFGTTDDVVKFYESVVPYIKEMIGAKKNYKPFYVNFPQQVMEMSDVELFFNAVLHYWSGGKWEPAQELKARGIKFEKTTFTMLDVKIGDDPFREIANNLATFSKPLDKQKLDDLIWIARNISNVEVGKITVKETLCELAAAGLNVKITSPTDVLRIATRLSGGEISLPAIPKPNRISSGWRTLAAKREAEIRRQTFKFSKFNRPQRKCLLGMLESLKTVDPSEMQPYLGRWIRLGEILHPGEYASKFPKTAAAFNALRNQKKVKVRTFAGKVDVAFTKSMEEGVKLLKTRPGEFARRLDALVRQFDTDVLPHFEEVVDKVSGKVIFEMFDHFEGRLQNKQRSVMLKGHGAKMQTLKTLPALPKKTVTSIQRIIMNSMMKRFESLPKMGKVFIDEGLKLQPVPFSMQSSADGLAVNARGTRFPIGDHVNTLRAFVHWNGDSKPIDIDLAAGFFTSDFTEKGDISFYSLSNRAIKACHSGDIRHRSGPCAEYIDINIESALVAGIRYVIFNVYNYDGTSLKNVDECLFGVMERSHPNSNEIFDPMTVASASKVQANSNSASPVAFDLQNRQWIWVDLEHDSRGIPCLAHDATTRKQFEALLGGSKMSVYDLLLLHVQARGGDLVDSQDQAEEVFTRETFADYTKLAPFMAV